MFATRKSWFNAFGAFSRLLAGGPDVDPAAAVPVVKTDPIALSVPPRSGLRVTWFGHSSSLVEIDGIRVLIDPIWGERASPVSWVGPRRWYAPPIELDRLPPVDVVFFSHDHYDHLDQSTVMGMRGWKAVFVAPLGVGQYLRQWGVPARNVVQLDWWESTDVGGVRLTLTPARHTSGRSIPRSDQTLWGGIAMLGAHHRAYYSGDTGLSSQFAEIGRRLGPFDAALIEAGQYDADWPDLHLGPEQAVVAAQRVGARVLIPVHWGLFQLAHHPWTEPVERVLLAARCSNMSVMTPRPGQSVEPTAPRAGDNDRWWPTTRWSTAAQNPIASTLTGDPAIREAPTPCRSLSR